MDRDTDYAANEHKQKIYGLGGYLKRPLMVFGFDDAPHGNAEIPFENVCVPPQRISYTVKDVDLRLLK